MQKSSFTAFKKVISASTNIVIVTHYNPDGDAMGSSLALYNYLLKCDKKVSVIVPNEYPDFLHWLPGHNKVVHFSTQEKKATALVQKAELIFTLDFNSLKRIEKLGPVIEKSTAKKIIIDHHQQPDDYASLWFHDVAACSTCELIYDFIKGLGGVKLIDKSIASCLYTGLMTDTGSFRFPSVTANTHAIIADLITKGAIPSDIHNAIYDTYSKHRMMLLGYCLTEKMTILEDYGVAYIYLTEKELQKFHYQKGDTEGIVNYPFSIKGIRFSAFFTEGEDKIKISFRSKGNFDVNQFARQHFGGGGHINAAGGKSEQSLKKTIDLFLSLLPSYSKQLQKK